MAMLVKEAVIMHKKILEEKRNGYVSELFDRALDEVERGMIIDEFNEQKQFT